MKRDPTVKKSREGTPYEERERGQESSVSKSSTLKMLGRDKGVYLEKGNQKIILPPLE